MGDRGIIFSISIRDPVFAEYMSAPVDTTEAFLSRVALSAQDIFDNSL